MATKNTRSRKAAEPDSTNNKDAPSVSNKRVADETLDRDNDKRSAFGDLTNAAIKKSLAVQAQNKKNLLRSKVSNKEKVKNAESDSSCKSSQEVKNSQESVADSTLFITACDTSVLEDEDSVPESVPELPGTSAEELKIVVPPPGVEDFDKSTLSDPYSEANYAREIFEYYKQREKKFALVKYLDRQPELSKGMRAILTDWLVEVQESFELNHETLYLAVKLVDHFLMRSTVKKSHLQLLGATAVFVACKFDERCPPLIDDFLYICDDAYSRHEMIVMELALIKTLNFDLGIPLSYRFLRRYARCAKMSMEILTLARYILESSLMEYDLIVESDSKIAAAALLLAITMKKAGSWSETLKFYSGYSESELINLVQALNRIISMPSSVRTLKTVRVKYSHKVFFEVAKIPPLPTA